MNDVMGQRRIGIAGGGCVMCELPPYQGPDDIAHAFAAALSMSESVMGNPSAFDVCPKHRDMIEVHRATHQAVSSPLASTAEGEKP